MNVKLHRDGGHRRAVVSVKASLRELGNQLSWLTHQVGSRVALKGADLDCLDLIGRYGPLSPSDLARRAGLHPATVTGVLDRLQDGGWVVRERDPQAADRRSVAVRALRDRNAELLRHYSGMNSAMDQLCSEYTADELALVAEFLSKTAAAGRTATEALAGS
ncbi:MAG: MarR family transcriptional regulator [Thermocrispum sp.]